MKFREWIETTDWDNYYNIGHSGESGDAIWWLTDVGNVEAFFLKSGEGQEVRHMKRMKYGWYGRYDRIKNQVSVAGYDSEFDKEYVRYVLSVKFPSASIIFYRS